MCVWYFRWEVVVNLTWGSCVVGEVFVHDGSKGAIFVSFLNGFGRVFSYFYLTRGFRICPLLGLFCRPYAYASVDAYAQVYF